MLFARHHLCKIQDLTSARFKTRQQAIQEIIKYIEIFYNKQRKQERLGYLSPAQFTQRYYTNLAAA